MTAPIIEYLSEPIKYVNAVPIIDMHTVFTSIGVEVTVAVGVTVGVTDAAGVIVEVTLGVAVLVGVTLGVAVLVGVTVGVRVIVGVGVAGGVLLHDCTSTVATISGTGTDPPNTLDIPVDISVVSASFFARTVP